MMQALRNKMKHIMMFVLLAFLATIIFSWGMGGFQKTGPLEKGIIGKINGREIKYQNYMDAVNQQLQLLSQQQADVDISEYQRKSIRDQVWNQMVQDVLYTEEIARLDITVSPEEIIHQLRNNPPSFLTSNPQFQTDGAFDITKYHQALNNPQNYDSWKPVENYLQGMIPVQKLQQRILGAVQVSELEVKEHYRQQNEKVKADIIFYNPASVPLAEDEIEETAVRDYYNNHKEAFLDPEKRQIDYVLLPQVPSAADTLETWDLAEYILEELKDGVSFEELAEAYSKDPGSAADGGDLGFFSADEMVAPFSEAVFSAKPGSVIGPVSTQYGLHVIEVLAGKREDGEKKMHARHILLKFEASNETMDNLYAQAQYIHDEAAESAADFTELCTQEGLTVQTSPYFSKQSFIPGIGMSDRLAYLTFSEKQGFVGGPLAAGTNIVVFQIKDIQKAGTKPFEETKASIRQTLTREKKAEKAAALCRAAHERLQAGADFEEIARLDSLEIISTDMFTITSPLPKIGNDPKVNGTAFSLSVDEISEPVISDRGSYLIRLAERQEIDESAFRAAYDDLHSTLLEQRQQEAYTRWYTRLQDEAEIEDYREMFF